MFENRDDFLLPRIVDQLLLEIGHFLKLVAVNRLRHRHAGLLDRQPHNRNQVGDDQYDVLRNLRPGDGAHAAKERTDQDATEPDEDADLERQPRQPRRDQAHAINLRDQVHERTQDCRDDAQEARQVALVARAQKVGDRELPELSQVRRQEQCHQAIAACPAQYEGQPPVACEIERAGQADERCGTQPIGASGHAVVDSGHPPTGHVIFGRVGGATHDADAGVNQHRGDQEHEADDVARHSHPFQERQDHNEGKKPAGVPGVDLGQLLFEAFVGEGIDWAGAAGVPACHVTAPRPRPRRGCGRARSCSGRKTRR